MPATSSPSSLPFSLGAPLPHSAVVTPTAELDDPVDLHGEGREAANAPGCVSTGMGSAPFNVALFAWEGVGGVDAGVIGTFVFDPGSQPNGSSGCSVALCCCKIVRSDRAEALELRLAFVGVPRPDPDPDRDDWPDPDLGPEPRPDPRPRTGTSVCPDPLPDPDPVPCPELDAATLRPCSVSR
mmetsp:Transcript_143808/g.251032  ORF Transcript_143808/g.251032 Transcript_143808/m.251032 type:complete len:183 (+) Transcript_143808:1283-1831(+)